MPTAAVCTKEVVHDKGKFGSTCGRDCHKCDEAGASVFVTAKTRAETWSEGNETGGSACVDRWGGIMREVVRHLKQVLRQVVRV